MNYGFYNGMIQNYGNEFSIPDTQSDPAEFFLTGFANFFSCLKGNTNIYIKYTETLETPDKNKIKNRDIYNLSIQLKLGGEPKMVQDLINEYIKPETLLNSEINYTKLSKSNIIYRIIYRIITRKDYKNKINIPTNDVTINNIMKKNGVDYYNELNKLNFDNFCKVIFDIYHNNIDFNNYNFAQIKKIILDNVYNIKTLKLLPTVQNKYIIFDINRDETNFNTKIGIHNIQINGLNYQIEGEVLHVGSSRKGGHYIYLHYNVLSFFSSLG